MLTHLDVSSGRLVALPRSIANLTSLQHLDVHSNLLRALPPLPASLVELNASVNELGPELGDATVDALTQVCRKIVCLVVSRLL